MNDQNSRRSTPLETRLWEALGTPRLSPGAYRDQLTRVETASHGAGRKSRLPRWANTTHAWATAAIVVAVAAIAIPISLIGVSSRDGKEIALWQEVAAAEQLMEFPPPGVARHLTIDVTRQEDRAGERAWVLDVWLRTLEDGTRETSVMAHDVQGQQIGRYIENRDGWYLEYRGSTSSGIGSAAWIPEELNPSQATSLALASVAVSDFDDSLVEVTESSGMRIYQVDVTTRLHNTSTGSSTGFDADGAIAAFLWTIKVDQKSGRPVNASLKGMHNSGTEVTFSERSLVSWTEQPAESVNQATFDIPAKAGVHEDENNMHFTLPPAGSLPHDLYAIVHTLDAHDAASGWYAERAVFVNDQGLKLELTVMPLGFERDTQHREDATVQTVDSMVGEIIWTSVVSRNRPDSATWSDQAFQYTLTVQQNGAWTIDDLITFVEQTSLVQDP